MEFGNLRCRYADVRYFALQLIRIIVAVVNTRLIKSASFKHLIVILEFLEAPTRLVKEWHHDEHYDRDPF